MRAARALRGNHILAAEILLLLIWVRASQNSDARINITEAVFWSHCITGSCKFSNARTYAVARIGDFSESAA